MAIPEPKITDITVKWELAERIVGHVKAPEEGLCFQSLRGDDVGSPFV